MSTIIYRIINVVNSKFYIGKTTKTTQERFQRHCYNHKTQNTYLYRAMRKYGIDKFVIEIIEETFNGNEREIYWIQTLKPHYNMTKGGEGGDTSNSPNFKKAIQQRDLSGSKNPMFGKKRKIPKQQLLNAHRAARIANRCPVSCDGIIFNSIGEAQIAFPGISVRKRLDKEKYPTFFRLRSKTNRKS